MNSLFYVYKILLMLIYCYLTVSGGSITDVDRSTMVRFSNKHTSQCFVFVLSIL